MLDIGAHWCILVRQAQVAEMGYARGLDPRLFGDAGSTPVLGTNAHWCNWQHKTL